MKKKILIIFFAIFLISCGNERNSDKDLVLFKKNETDALYQMQFEGRNIKRVDEKRENYKQWDRQRELLNNICSGWSNDPTSPISVISPDGASMGSLEEAWEPNWSPNGSEIAVACARDDDGNVFVVSNTEKTGSNEGWSRDGTGYLSDRVEIYVVGAEGSNLVQLTDNEAGDWLPRWFPSTQVSPDSEFAKQVVSSNPLLIESNRDGNSEIYLLSTISTKSWRLTISDSQDQSPVWSSNGTAVVFASDRSGSVEIYYTLNPSTISIEETGELGRPQFDK